MTRLSCLTLALCALCIQACTADDLVREPSPSTDQAWPDLPTSDVGLPDMAAAADMPPPQDMPSLQDMPPLQDMAPPRDFGRRCVIGPEDFWTANRPKEIEALRGCGVITGTISLSPSSDPRVFAPLENLVILEGGFIVAQVGSGWDGSLQGLERLEEIRAQDPASGGSNAGDGRLQLSRVDTVDLRPLSNLRRIEGELRLLQMFVPSLEGLENVRTTGGLFISNGALRDLSGLSGLERVEGDVRLQTENFEALRGLDALKRIDGDVSIQCSLNVSRRDIEAFLSGIEVGGKVTLEDC